MGGRSGAAIRVDQVTFDEFWYNEVSYFDTRRSRDVFTEVLVVTFIQIETQISTYLLRVNSAQPLTTKHSYKKNTMCEEFNKVNNDSFLKY